MKILLADKQDITRAGLNYVISKMEGLETQTVEDKADLLLTLRENEDTVVILDYTLFDINDAAELLILNQRFPYTRWLLFSEDLSTDFVKILIASSTQFSVLLKECSLMELKEAIRFCVASNRFVCQRMMEVLLAPKQEEQEKINLTKTETEILKDIALGMTTKEIAEKRIGRLHHAPLHGIGSEPYDLACRADRPLELFAAGYRHRLDRPGASQISDLDLGREAGDTIRDFPLETHDNGQSQNHHRHAQRHRDHGDTNHHTRTVAGSVMRDSARYEQFEIHPLPILHVFFMQSNINFSYFCSINRPL